MKEIKLGTIGSGPIVRSILDNVNRIDGIRLVAVYSRNEETGNSLASEYAASKVYTDMDAFLEDEDINFIYIASPNLLHYPQAKKALQAGKHVILEKPFCTKAEHAKELVELAKAKGLFLIDAVPTTFLPNFDILCRELPKIGKVKGVQANYSQYSSRYDALVRGELPNVFNPAYGGGCLMDINFYNVYLNIALFGKPKTAVYYPDIYKGIIDTSGTMVMSYSGFTSESAGAKDADGLNFFRIEGEKGYINIHHGSNGLAEVSVVENGAEELFNRQEKGDRWFYEMQMITELVLADNYDAIYRRLDTMLDVIEVIETARIKAGILFPGD